MKKDRFRLFDFDETGNWGKLKAPVLEIFPQIGGEFEAKGMPTSLKMFETFGFRNYILYTICHNLHDVGEIEVFLNNYFCCYKVTETFRSSVFLYSAKCWGTKNDPSWLTRRTKLLGG